MNEWNEFENVVSNIRGLYHLFQYRIFRILVLIIIIRICIFNHNISIVEMSAYTRIWVYGNYCDIKLVINETYNRNWNAIKCIAGHKTVLSIYNIFTMSILERFWLRWIVRSIYITKHSTEFCGPIVFQATIK